MTTVDVVVDVGGGEDSGDVHGLIDCPAAGGE